MSGAAFSLLDEGAFEKPRPKLWELPLMEFIPAVSPQFMAPRHLQPIVDVLDRCLTEKMQVCTSTPPRHTKTSTIAHWIVKTVAAKPRTFIGYATYNQSQAEHVSAQARTIARAAGVEFETDTLAQWVLKNGSRVTWGGVGASWTGKGFHVIIPDDLVKNREEAESPLIRDKAFDWFNGVLFTRQEPGARGTSVMPNGTRWHHDDPIGRLIRMGWPFVNLPAINDNNEALWPGAGGFSVERLREIEAQIGPYEFSALYQGRPVARGAEVFGAPHYYDELPVGVGYATSIGGDFAYTVKTWSDFSVAVVLRRYTTGLCYVVDVLRLRCELPTFRGRLRLLAERHNALHSVGAFVSGTEKGGLSFFEEGEYEERVRVEPFAATSDKFMRSQPFAAAWNAGRVLLPRNIKALGDLGRRFMTAEVTEDKPVPWVECYLDEHRSFTGIKDAFDDQIDASAGAYEPFRVLTMKSDTEARRPRALAPTGTDRWGGGDGGRGYG